MVPSLAVLAFRALCKKRASEKRDKLKKLLASNRELIMERRKHSPTEPFPENSFAKLASNQVLERIVALLTDPVDRTSLYFSCQKFRELVAERRVQSLLPEVMGILNTHQDKYLQVQKQTRSSFYDRQARKKEELVQKLCSVDKFWKETVQDEFIEKKFSKKENDIGGNIWSDYVLCDIRSYRSLKKWFALLEDTDRSFTPRTLRLRESTIRNGKQSSRLDHFLEKHGKRFWSFTYHPNVVHELDQIYERFWWIVKCLPNIREMYLQADGFGYGEGQRAREIFRSKLEQLPFHNIPSLHYFGADFCAPDVLIGEILEKNPTVQRVTYTPYESTDRNNRLMKQASRNLRLEAFKTV